MKLKCLFSIALVCFFIGVNAFAFDGTGKWTFTGKSPWDNCEGYTHTADSGTVLVLQTDSSFLIVGDDYSAYGSVSGSIYTYSDHWCEMGGVVTQQTVLTLTSDTVGTGTVDFTWSDGVNSCTGGHALDLSKESTASPVYDASGKWNFTQSGFSSTCGSSTPPKSSGYFVITQTGNKITAVDDEGMDYSGYANGSTYYVFRSYLESGGTTTVAYAITLGSETTGSGNGRFVWDDHCDDCDGGWSISIAKDVYTIIATSSAGGSISPSGTFTVDGGASQAFLINTDSGYKIEDVLVDGASAGAKTSYTFSNVSSNHTIHAVFRLNTAACESLILEGFEGGVLPPSGWQVRTTNQDCPWEISNSPHTGNYGAQVLFDPSLKIQDELLLSGRLSIKEAILHFWSMGSIAWCRDTYDNCDLEVWIVVGEWDGGSGDDIFVGKADNDWVENFQWADSSFNLTSKLPGEPIRIGFRYKGMDGDGLVIDDIQICTDKPAGASIPYMLLLLED